LAVTQASLEKRRAIIDPRHRYLLEKFATIADAKPQELENLFLLGSKIEMVNDFFKENGTRKIFFFWQPNKVCSSQL
jgi:dynein heavy chain